MRCKPYVALHGTKLGDAYGGQDIFRNLAVGWRVDVDVRNYAPPLREPKIWAFPLSTQIGRCLPKLKTWSQTVPQRYMSQILPVDQKGSLMTPIQGPLL